LIVSRVQRQTQSLLVDRDQLLRLAAERIELRQRRQPFAMGVIDLDDALEGGDRAQQILALVAPTPRNLQREIQSRIAIFRQKQFTFRRSLTAGEIADG